MKIFKSISKSIIALVMTIVIAVSCMIPSFAYNENQIDESVKVEIDIPKVNWDEILPEVTVDGVPFMDLFFDFLADLSDALASLYDQIVFLKYGRVDLEKDDVRVSFSKTAFGEVSEELQLYVEKTSVEELTACDTDYCGFTISPLDREHEVIAYRVAIVDKEGNVYSTPTSLGHRIHVEIITPEEWADYDILQVSHYDYWESDGEWNIWSSEENNNGSVFMIYTSL